MPASVVTFFCAPWIVELIYEGHAFDATATVRVARALAVYGLGLSFFAIQKCMIPFFLIFGGVRARRIRDELNAAEVSFLNNKKDHLVELRKETSILKTKQRTMLQELKEHEAMLPPSLRSSAQISKAKIFIQSGKAEDFADAVEKMGRL